MLLGDKQASNKLITSLPVKNYSEAAGYSFLHIEIQYKAGNISYNPLSFLISLE